MDHFLSGIKQTPCAHPCKASMGLTHPDVPDNHTTQNVACRSEESASPGSLMEMPSLGTHLPPRLNEARSAFQQDVQVICKCVTDWEVFPLETFCILKRYHWGDKARWQVLKGKPSTSISVKYSSPLKSTCRTYNKRWAGRGKSSTSSPYGTFRKK